MQVPKAERGRSLREALVLGLLGHCRLRPTKIVFFRWPPGNLPSLLASGQRFHLRQGKEGENITARSLAQSTKCSKDGSHGCGGRGGGKPDNPKETQRNSGSTPQIHLRRQGFLPVKQSSPVTWKRGRRYSPPSPLRGSLSRSPTSDQRGFLPCLVPRSHTTQQRAR